MALGTFPWTYLIRRAIRAHGLMDPITLLSRIRRFAEPSEVHEPLELVRGWVIFHARGIINTRAIQHNLDWVWPYWIERQFNPQDSSFIPRAYSLSHINLTHRNWTAVGLPGVPLYPTVDPRGLLVPQQDGWSLDCWVIPDDGEPLLPSRLNAVEQWQENDEQGLRVVTRATRGTATLTMTAWMDHEGGEPVVRFQAKALCGQPGRLVVSLRPYNPEGIQFIDRVDPEDQRGRGWRINQQLSVLFPEEPASWHIHDYSQGDVFRTLDQPNQERRLQDKVGMITAAAIFNLEEARERLVEVRVPLGEELARTKTTRAPNPSLTWAEARRPSARLQVPDRRVHEVFESSLTTLLLLSADEVFPGPAIYRRFWFRDACLILSTLLDLGHPERVRAHLELFPKRQRKNGYFLSQDGEWDSNGQVLWLAERFERLTGETLSPRLHQSLRRAADWIIDRRLKAGLNVGLYPPGFSAEHLGPNNYYYWDNFWGWGGLQAAARLCDRWGDQASAARYREEATNFADAIWRTLAAVPVERSRGAIPAAPGRRLDAGAVGSIVADFPLKLVKAGDPRIMATVDFLRQRCFQNGGFFQDMTHSGINAYLTLQIAQVLLRAGQPEQGWLLFEGMTDYASPTGHWPEAIHPWTRGGCMGDGQHAWAAADYCQYIRNCFVREDEGCVIIGSGLPEGWLTSAEDLRFGPTLTSVGTLVVEITGPERERRLLVQGVADAPSPAIRVAIPGYRAVTGLVDGRPIVLEKDSDAHRDVHEHLRPGHGRRGEVD